MGNAFTIIAHRGFSSQAPENTQAAFDLAITTGFTNLELDVQLTSDNKPVIIHDATVNRTTNGSGNLKGYTLQDLQALDAGSWFNPNFSNERVMTLDELLDRYAHKAHLHIELKSEEPELPSIVSDALQSRNLLNEEHSNLFEIPGITITSFKSEQL